jgi:hypothetical protein
MCTIGAVFPKKSGMIIFKNRDLVGKKTNPEPRVVKGKKWDYLKFGVDAKNEKPGVWTGVNAKGVGIVGADGNSLLNFAGEAYAKGEKTWETYEEVLANAGSAREAYKLVIDSYEDMNIGGTGDIVLIADPKGAVVLEYLPHMWGVEFIRDRPYVVRTNFFQVMQHLRPSRDTNGLHLSSHLRFERAMQMLSPKSGDLDVEDIKRLCQDHANGPSAQSICRHGGEGEYRTLCSAIMEVQNEKIVAHYVMNQNPCQATYKTLSAARQ